MVIFLDVYWLKVIFGGQVVSMFGINGLFIWEVSLDQWCMLSNYVISMFDDVGGFFLCQSWINNMKVSQQVEVVLLQVLVQCCFIVMGELSILFVVGGMGWLLRQQDLVVSCIGVWCGSDGCVLVFMDYGFVECLIG